MLNVEAEQQVILANTCVSSGFKINLVLWLNPGCHSFFTIQLTYKSKALSHSYSHLGLYSQRRFRHLSKIAKEIWVISDFFLTLFFCTLDTNRGYWIGSSSASDRYVNWIQRCKCWVCICLANCVLYSTQKEKHSPIFTEWTSLFSGIPQKNERMTDKCPPLEKTNSRAYFCWFMISLFCPEHSPSSGCRSV